MNADHGINQPGGQCDLDKLFQESGGDKPDRREFKRRLRQGMGKACIGNPFQEFCYQRSRIMGW